jgi:trimeric autotransporter adhesin
VNRPLPSSKTSALQLFRLHPISAAARRLALALGCAALPAMAQNLPVGPGMDGAPTQVTGSATVGTVGNVMTIMQMDTFVHLDWNTFDIANGFTVEVNQAAEHFLLNHVTGGARSDIEGTLRGALDMMGNATQTNGVVALVNPAGVVVSTTGVINVGGLLLSSFGLVDDTDPPDLNPSGNQGNGPRTITFSSGSADNLVDNQGSITVGAGGATLLGRSVSNGGTIAAVGGPVQLVAGDDAVIDVDDPSGVVRPAATIVDLDTRSVAMGELAPAVSNSGTITSGTSAGGGEILLQAQVVPGMLPNVINNTGLLSAAATVNNTPGGNVTLIGNGGGVSTVHAPASDPMIPVDPTSVSTAGMGSGTGGNVTITATRGNITVGAINAGTGDVELIADSVAGQQILDDETGLNASTTRIVGDDIILDTTGGVGTLMVGTSGVFSGSDIDLAANSLTATATDSGAININELDSVTFTLNDGSGARRLSTGDSLDTGNFTDTAEAVAFESRNGNLTVGNIVASNIGLSAGGTIVDGNAAVLNATATTLTMTAGTGIGAVDAVLDPLGAFETKVDSIRANVTGTGNITLAELDGATLSSITTTDGNIAVTTAAGNLTTAGVITAGSMGANNVTLTATTGSILDDQDTLNGSNGRITGNTIALNSDTGVGTATADIDVNAGTMLTATATTSGDININEADTVTTFELDNTGAGTRRYSQGNALNFGDYAGSGQALALESRTGNLTVGNLVAGSVTLSSGTGSVLDGNMDAVNVAAGMLTVTAATGIGAMNNALDTKVTMIDANVTGTGGIVLAEADGATLSSVTTASGDITVTSAMGDLTATTIRAGATGGNDVTLTATTGAIRDDQTGLDNTGTRITGNLVRLTAGTGIGAADANVDTAAMMLDASAGAGGMTIDQAGAVNLIDVDTTSGAIAITASGTITATDVDSVGGGTSLTANGVGSSIQVGTISAAGNAVNLTASMGSIGEIPMGDLTADITASSLNAQAGNGVNLDTNIDTLTNAAGGSGAVDINDLVGDLAVGAASGTNVTLRSAGQITDGDGSTDITADNGLLDVSAANGISLDTAVGSLTASGGTGAVDISETGDIAVNTVTSETTVTLAATGAITDGNAADADNVIATSLTATSNTGVTLDTKIVTLTNAQGGSGTVSIEDREGSLSVAAASGSNVTLSSVGALTGGNIMAPTGQLTAAGSSIDLGTTVQSLDASAIGMTAGSNIVITETDGIVLTAVDTVNGSITVSAGGQVTATNVVSSTSTAANTIILSTTAGNLIADTINAGPSANVTLTANTTGLQQILDDDAGSDSTSRITGNLVKLQAGGGIGANGDVDIAAGTLEATTGSGALNVNESDTVVINTFSNNGAGNIGLSVGGPLTVGVIDATNHDIRLETRGSNTNDLTVGALTGGNVTLISAGAISGGDDAGASDVNANTLTALSTTGVALDTNIGTLTSAVGGSGATTINDLSNDLAVTAATGSSVTLSAPGAITGGGISTATLTVTGGSINLNTAVQNLNASAIGAAPSGNLVVTNSTSISLDDVDTQAGAIQITAGGTITATDVSAIGGNATLTANGGAIQVGTVSAAGNTVTLTAAGAITDIVPDTAVDVTAGALVAQSGAGIDLDTDVGTITANSTGPGDVTIDETSEVTLTSVSTNNGAVTVTAGGTITAGSVTAVGGAAMLSTLGTGSIMSGTVSGPSVTLNALGGQISGVSVNSAGRLTATAANGINVSTAVDSLDASVTGAGALTVVEASGITLADVDTASGAIMVTAGGTIAATDVASTGGNTTLIASNGGSIQTGAVSALSNTVTLTAAGGALTDSGSDVSADVTANTLLAQAGNGIDLDTAIETLGNAAGGSGAVDINDLSGNLAVGTVSGSTVTLASAGTISDGNAQGTANVTSAGSLRVNAVNGIDLDTDITTLTTASGGSGAVDINDLSGGLAIGTVSGTTITLASSGAITDANAAASNVTGSSLSASAASGIDLDTDIVTLANAASGSGAVNINDASGDLAVGTASGSTVTLASAGAITDANAAANNITAPTLTVTAVSGIDLDTNIDTLTAAGGSGSVNVADSAGNLAINTVTGSSVILASAGAITAGSAGVNVTTGAFTATAVTGIDLDTRVASLDATVSGAGNIGIDEADGIELTAVDTAAGNIGVNANGTIAATNVAANGGDVTLNAVGSESDIAAGRITGDTVTLTAGRAITDANGLDTVPASMVATRAAGNNVTANTLIASARTGITLDTEVASLSANVSGAGDIAIREATAVTTTTLSTTDGSVSLVAGGQLTIPNVVVGGEGNLTLASRGAGIALGQADAGGNTVVLDAAGNVTDTNGDTGNIITDTLDLTAGGSIDLDIAVESIEAAGGGSVRLDEADDISVGSMSGQGVTLTADDVTIRNDGQINGGTGAVVITSTGTVQQEQGRGTVAAVSGGSITINAAEDVGLLTLPLSVDAGGGFVAVNPANPNFGFVSGVFGVLNEGPRVIGLASNTVLSNNVGAIQSSFEERVSFRLDSSQFATESRIFAVEGTGILPPDDQRE